MLCAWKLLHRPVVAPDESKLILQLMQASDTPMPRHLILLPVCVAVDSQTRPAAEARVWGSLKPVHLQPRHLKLYFPARGAV